MSANESVESTLSRSAGCHLEACGSNCAVHHCHIKPNGKILNIFTVGCKSGSGTRSFRVALISCICLGSVLYFHVVSCAVSLNVYHLAYAFYPSLVTCTVDVCGWL